MICKDCKRKISDCERYCPHDSPQEKLPDFSITIYPDRFVIQKRDSVIIDQSVSYDKDLLGFASVAYNKVSTIDNVVQIWDKVSGMRIVRDRKVDQKTIYRQLNSAKRLMDKNR